MKVEKTKRDTRSTFGSRGNNQNNFGLDKLRITENIS